MEIATSGLLLSRLAAFSRLAGQLIDRKLAPLGITYQEMRLAGLLMGEKNITQKELAEKLSVRPATISVALSKLEQQGLVKRTPSSTDKRANYLKLLPSKKVSTVDKLLTEIESELCQGISKKELETTRKVLDQLIERLGDIT